MPSIIPSPGPRPSVVNFTSSVFLNGTLTISAGTTLLAEMITPSPILPLYRSTFSTDKLINNGAIWSNPKSTMNGGYIIVQGATVENNGVMVLLADLFPNYSSQNRQDVTVIDGRSGLPSLTNTGQIFAIATNGDAQILQTISQSPVVNSGLLAASAATGTATTLYYFNGGLVTNQATGRILAEGLDAIAIRVGRGLNLTNFGLIEAQSLDPQAPSVAIYGAHLENELFRIENGGTIRGDWAILMYSTASPDPLGAEVILNLASGLIDGDVFLGLGDDFIQNAGTIRGRVLMGEGADRVDTAAGRIEGSIDLGWGNDQFVGGAFDDLAAGDNGDDNMQGGGGNDLLMGGGSNDTLIGGAGNDGLFGEWGSDRIVTEAGDVVGGGDGNDRIELGDYQFEFVSGDAGFDTLVLPAGSRIFDLSSALAEGALAGFEAIEMGGSRSLVVRGGDVPALTGALELRIDATATDTLYLVGSWAAAGNVTVAGSSYRKYQQGAETVLVSAAPTVNLGASAPAGAQGLDPVPGPTPAPLPGPDTLDFTSPVYYLEGYQLTAPLTVVNPEELWYGNGLHVLLADKPGVNLDNYGAIVSTAATSPFSQTAYLRNMGTFNNYGVVLAISDYDGGQPKGAQEEFVGFVNALGKGGTVNNFGIIGAETNTGVAVGSTNTQNLINRGEIYAISVNGFAIAVDQPDRLTNHGLIHAEGGYSAVGVYVFFSGSVNNNRIEAVTTGAGALESVGVRIFGRTTATEFTNAGTITADIAVESYRIAQAINGAVALSNTGTLNGKVILANGADTIVNTGTINGDVSLGAGNDTFNGTGGVQSGKVSGDEGDDVLTGGAGADRLEGGVGADQLDGGAGADIFIYRAIGESTASTPDQIRNFQHLSDRIDVSALGLPQSHSFVAGGDGWTTLTVTTATGSLVLRVQGIVTIDDLIIPVVPGLTLAGTDGGDLLEGGAGADILSGLGGDDQIFGFAGNDLLDGGAGNDSLSGGLGNDGLIGGAGDDAMSGGGGNDSYVVDSAGDQVIEAIGGGSDAVYTFASYTLAAGQEIEALLTYVPAATLAFNLTGNAFDQLIQGNAGANSLIGGGGADTLQGLGGNDTYVIDSADDQVIEAVGGGSDAVYTFASYTLTAGQEIEALLTYVPAATLALNLTGNAFGQLIQGNAGANILIGGGGADTLQGLGGDDLYVIDSADDVVLEASGQGYDAIYTSVSYVLGAGAQVEILSTDAVASTASISLTGNAFGQLIQGNNGSNGLIGGGGSDFFYGQGGNDHIVVDSDDAVFENVGGGSDSVYATQSFTLTAGAEVENVVCLDPNGAAEINLDGNEFAQSVQGNDWGNIIDGKGGADYLLGRGGADTFKFSTAVAGANVDTILDFTATIDKVGLDHNIYTGMALGALAAGSFRIGTTAQDADDRILFDDQTGRLFFDPDGAGGSNAVHFATLVGNNLHLLSANDFVVL